MIGKEKERKKRKNRYHPWFAAEDDAGFSSLYKLRKLKLYKTCINDFINRFKAAA